MGKIVIVKLGGAAISNKRGVCELAPEEQLEAMFEQVRVAYQELKRQGYRLLLVHGAGCFGHPQAKQYKLKAGWSPVTKPDGHYLKGYSHIRSCLQQLSYSIISGLEKKDIPVLAMSPIDYIQTTNCEETTTEAYKTMASRVNQYLDLGFVPVLHGDAVLDHVRGCTILSGDIIMHQLSILLENVVRCIFITDVSGVYQSDPKLNSKSNKLITRISVNNAEEEQLVPQQEERIDSNSTLADVTGGMQGKIKWAKKIVSNPTIDAIICKWGSEEALDMMTLKPSQTIATDCNMTVFIHKDVEANE